ncbi:unannotated protein [freshwater metagenome]|uniref:Unannotated protein n=1 Tax=freshwater metagenome TaxID=449393 RepID=A0A6J7KEN3_9ZZZZ|nr:amidohydrolase family protein [Actinomycetota bacterium]
MSTPTDLHQHAWPEPFLAALSARTDGPRTRVEADGSWRLLLPGEPACALGECEIDLHRREGALFAAGLDRALLVPPLAIGVDGLEPDDARQLLISWHEGVLAHGGPFGVWAAVPSRDPQPRDLRLALSRGAVGLALPAAALADADALERFGPVLEELARADRPLFVHPGAPAGGAAAGRPDDAPWWPALGDYTGQLLRAWATWLDRGHRAHPTLRVAFAALAGGGALMLERLAARGGPVELARSEHIAYETSSFGPRTIAAAAQSVGADRLAFGSDRPVVAPEEQHVPVVAGIDPVRLASVAAGRLLGDAASPAAPEATPGTGRAPVVAVAA